MTNHTMKVLTSGPPVKSIGRSTTVEPPSQPSRHLPPQDFFLLQQARHHYGDSPALHSLVSWKQMTKQMMKQMTKQMTKQMKMPVSSVPQVQRIGRLSTIEPSTRYPLPQDLHQPQRTSYLSDTPVLLAGSSRYLRRMKTLLSVQPANGIVTSPTMEPPSQPSRHLLLQDVLRFLRARRHHDDLQFRQSRTWNITLGLTHHHTPRWITFCNPSTLWGLYLCVSIFYSHYVTAKKKQN